MAYQVNLLAAAAAVCAEHKGPPACRARRGRRRANEGVFPRPPGTAGTRGPVLSPRDTAGSRSTPTLRRRRVSIPRRAAALAPTPERAARPARRDGSDAPGPVEPPLRGGSLAYRGLGYRRDHRNDWAPRTVPGRPKP